MYKHTWRIYPLFTLAVAAFLFMLPHGAKAEDATAGGSSPPPYQAVVQHDVQAVVVRIIDGDSLVVDIPTFPLIIGKRIPVRIANCDTPEKNDKNPAIRARANAAKRFTASLAPPGSTVWLRQIQRDKYFRLLARVEAAGRDLTDALIANGLALPYDGGKKTAFAGAE